MPLVDPAGLLDMERCGEIAGRMEEAASRSGYGAGARMASILGDVFADVADIVNRPVEDGALHYTTSACREMRALLYGTAKSYREGRDGEPVGGPEELRRSVARLKSGADAYREKLGAADPSGSGLCKYDSLHRGMICRDVIRKDIEKIRAERRARGVDPIFPPKRGSIDDILDRCDGPRWSAAEIMDCARGKGPPDGYEMVRVESGRRRRGQGPDRLP